MSLGNERFRVDAVIFDLDGTLIDSMDVYFSIMRVVFERLEFPPLSREEMWGALKEKGFEWASVLPEEVLPRQEEVIARARGIIDEVSPLLFRQEVRPIPGVAEMLRDISRTKMKIALVTSTPSKHLDVKLFALRTFGVGDLFDEIITADDAPKKKPAADPLIECARRLGVLPNKSVYIGDSRVDIISGKAAGMKTVGVLTGIEDYESLKREDPDAILSSVAELRGMICFDV
ncbi:MAG: HAD family hydrolase [Desulfobacterales bacterium]|nr:HAD family hydrolase [Desulfobacterales bacterium]